ncbi:MAG: hypothetical protein ACI9VR_000587 [Cognaticolwellia sp.]|jgi:hypothetical protein
MNRAQSLLLMASLFVVGCEREVVPEGNDTAVKPTYTNPDFNGDDTIRILVMGTNASIDGGEGFSPDQVAQELQSILDGDPSISSNVMVVAEDIHASESVTLGLGGSGSEYTYTHHSHSLTQYYFWPDAADARMANLTGNGAHDWDYVVIGADPYIVSTTPGFYALGVNKIASKVADGGAQPLLLMTWPQEQLGSSMADVEEFTYRVADGAAVELPTVPAGLAWASLSDDQKDESGQHPTPNGAYLTAASIYAHITGSNAGNSGYEVDAGLADVALDTVDRELGREHYAGSITQESPFAPCGITDDVVTYNHTGSSSENGILDGLRWVFDQAPETLESGGESPITFNYGRANSNFEPEKRYQVDPAKFDFSFGFPMQDHGDLGDVSMLYGLDLRDSGVVNDTDLGVARHMLDQSELPFGRAIPIRTLFAQMREANPEQSAYRDSWHMHRDLDKAIGAYMYTLMTGTCVLAEEPGDTTSSEWNTWKAHKIGCDTAWTLMTLEGESSF